MSTRRVRAVFRKELREYRRNAAIIATMAVLPLIFLVEPIIQVLTFPAGAAATLREQKPIIYLLAIPAIVPAALAAYAIVGERQQGTLEPVLTTPIPREELLIGKALAVLVPTIAIAYGVFGVFLAVVELFAVPAVASAVVVAPTVVAQVVFTPLIAAAAIWLGIGVSARTSDVRTSQQLSTLASLPLVATTTLIAIGKIPATLGLALVFGAVLLALDVVGWRIVAPLFDRERLMVGTRAGRRSAV